VTSVAHCGRTGDEGRFNTLDVVPAPGLSLDVEALGAARRGTLTTASCGVCGRRSIDDLLARCKPLDPVIVPRAAVLRATEALGRTQSLFARTGGCHGAALIRFDGTHVATFEDVGRHNAVDKLVGSRLLAHALPLAGHVLAVSGRSSFEIVQKAVAAGIPAIASISAASSLAVDLAKRTGLVLAGFVRGEGMTLYTGDVSDD